MPLDWSEKTLAVLVKCSLLMLKQKLVSFSIFLVCLYKTLLPNLVPSVQFKKRETHPWRSVTFSIVAG